MNFDVPLRIGSAVIRQYGNPISGSVNIAFGYPRNSGSWVAGSLTPPFNVCICPISPEPAHGILHYLKLANSPFDYYSLDIVVENGIATLAVGQTPVVPTYANSNLIFSTTNGNYEMIGWLEDGVVTYYFNPVITTGVPYYLFYTSIGSYSLSVVIDSEGNPTTGIDQIPI